MAVRFFSRPITKPADSEEQPSLHLVGRVRTADVPRTIAPAPAPVHAPAPSFSLEPLVRAQQNEIAALHELVGTLRDQVSILSETLMTARVEAHDRERDLIRVLHRYILAEQA